MLIELAALAYCADKSNKMDAQALAKRSKAFTKEAEARDLVYQKRSTAEKKMQNVAKKKRAIIESTLPRFVEVYQKIQKIDLTISDKNELAVYNQFQQCHSSDASRHPETTHRRSTDHRIYFQRHWWNDDCRFKKKFICCKKPIKCCKCCVFSSTICG